MIRTTLRIARWEVARSAGAFDRRTLVALAAVLAVLGALTPILVNAGGTPDSGIYRVGVDDDSPYRPAVEEARELRAVPVEAGVGAVAAGRVEVVIREGNRRTVTIGGGRTMTLAAGDTDIVFADTQRGRATVVALRDAVDRYNDRVMREQPDRAAAFPVTVTLRYVTRDLGGVSAPGDTGGDSPDGTTDGDGSGGTAGDDGTTDGDGPGGDAGEIGDDGATGGTDDDGVGDALQSAGQAFLGGGQTGTPSDISPPFPLQSLVLAFAFLLPMNVVIQAYGSSMMGERLNRRGELLLVSPAGARDIVAGKTLPYLAVSLLAAAGVAAVIGAGPLSVLAVAPIAVLFLASTFVGAMFARSFTELTFVTVTISVFVTSYAFIPAIFTDVHPIASISPLSVVVRDITGTSTGLATLAFSTLPMTLAAGVLFALGLGVYREEDIFTQLPPPAKAVDAVAAHLTFRRLPLWTALSLPFVFVAELFVVAVLFVGPVAVSLPILLVAVAAIEEVAKSLPVYAGFERGRFPRNRRTALLGGVLAGVGFAVGEKLSLTAQLVGLPELELGRAAFADAGVGAVSGPLIAALLLAPFVLHAVTATVSAVGARRSRRAYAVALLVATLLHTAYNVAVVGQLA